MKKKYAVFLSFLLITLFLKAQNFQEYLPPSPTAQEFVKYGEYPVGMYTGVPSISIPLYTVEVKDLKIPISLSYHASGIQVDQVATWIGLGWSLSAGGVISKIPRGTPDDVGKGYLMTDVPEKNELTLNDSSFHDFYEEAATGQRDTESDIYHYNFGEYSGKFFFDRNKNIRFIEKYPIKIDYVEGIFVITTTEGLVYEFKETEKTSTQTYSPNPFSTNPQNYTSSWHLTKVILKNKKDVILFNYEEENGFSTYQYNYSEATGGNLERNGCDIQTINNYHGFGNISSQTKITHQPKRLKEIITPNGKLVFNRVHGRQDIVNDKLNEIVAFKKEGNTYKKIKSFEFVHDYFYSNHTNFYPEISTDARRYRLKLTELREFDQNHENAKKHLFEYDKTILPPIETNGKDYWGYYNGKNTNYTLIPKQAYQYYGNNVGSADRNPNSAYMQAGILKKITYPTGGYTEFYYEPHEYKTTETNTTTKKRKVFAIGQEGVIGGGVPYEDSVVFTPNHSGYATLSIEASDMTSYKGVFPTISMYIQGSNNHIIHYSTYNQTSQSKIEKTFSPVWLNKGVSYVLKAEAKGASNSNEFDGAAFMIANLSYNEEVLSSVPVIKITGGLRTKQIKSFHKNNEHAFSKRYEYGEGTLITPEVFLKEHYVDAIVELGISDFSSDGTCGILCLQKEAAKRFYYGGTVQSLTLKGGSPVVYNKVTEFITNEYGANNGEKVYTYDVQTDDVIPAPTAYKGGVMVLDKSWMGGQNISETTYNNTQEPYREVASKVNGYTLKKYDESYKMYKIIHSKMTSGCYVKGDTDRYQIIEYPIYTGIKLIKGIEQSIIGTDNLEVIANKNIFYDNETHLQPNRSETIASDGKKVETKTKYPDDISSTDFLELPNLTTAEYNAINKLKKSNQHRISEPIQTETTVKDDGGKIISKTIQRTTYKDWGNNLILPEKVLTSKGDATLEPRILYIRYDSYGNPTELQKVDGATITYLWGYNGQYPVAKIENATYSAVINTGVDLSVLTSSTSSEASRLTELNKIRNHSNMSGAMVTTYTYDPLVGVSTITDPRGVKTTYEYDNFNRLEFIKDEENKLLEQYQYHYKN